MTKFNGTIKELLKPYEDSIENNSYTDKMDLFCDDLMKLKDISKKLLPFKDQIHKQIDDLLKKFCLDEENNLTNETITSTKVGD